MSNLRPFCSNYDNQSFWGKSLKEFYNELCLISPKLEQTPDKGIGREKRGPVKLVSRARSRAWRAERP